MENTLDKYLFQAIDAYPYNLEETIESLNYALSYNPKSTKALCLMGQLYANQLKDYETAKAYFQEALSINIYALDVYEHYINVLLWNSDLEEAEKLIRFALKIKGIDKAVLLVKNAQIFEQKQHYKSALKELKKAKQFTYNNEFMEVINEEKTRIKSKMKPAKKKSNKKRKSKKK